MGCGAGKQAPPPEPIPPGTIVPEDWLKSSFYKMWKHEDDKKVKMLVVGTPQSGKKTMAKQYKIGFKEGYTDTERAAFKSIVIDNVHANAKALVDGAEKLGIASSEMKVRRADVA